MIQHVSVPTPYHQQDTDYYCGAACAQVMIAAAGRGLRDQDELYNEAHNASRIDPQDRWYAAPDGLTACLQQNLPLHTPTLVVADTADQVTDAIVASIVEDQLPAAILTNCGGHWNVVSGVSLNVRGSGSKHLNLIEAFDVIDPLPPVPSLRGPSPFPPPHGPGDGCGRGHGRGDGIRNLAYWAWLYWEVFPVVPDGMWTHDHPGAAPGRWDGKYVAITLNGPRPLSVPSAARPELPPPRPQLLSPDEARACAVEALEAKGLAHRPSWSSALTATGAGRPVLVQMLHRANSFYYLVPFGTDAGHEVVSVQIDASSGAYASAVCHAEPVRSPAPIRPAVVERRLEGRRVDLPGRAGRVQLRRHGFSVYPTWVWRPCRESTSPFQPFRLITAGEHRFYEGTDDRFHSALHQLRA